MRNEIEKFHHTIGVLVKAYIQGTIEHSNCHACAVGNMVADACGFKFTRDNDFQEYRWDNHIPVWYDAMFLGEVNYNRKYSKEAVEQGELTGYTYAELAKIEHAFEFGYLMDYESEEDDPDGYDGLMAVVDVLAKIHGIDLSTLEETKKLFVKEN